MNRFSSGEDENKKTSIVELLDNDCLTYIFSYMIKEKDFLRLMSVCKRWKRVIIMSSHLTISETLFNSNNYHFDVSLFTNLTSLQIMRYRPKLLDPTKFIFFLKELKSNITTLRLTEDLFRTKNIADYFKNLTSLTIDNDESISSFRDIEKFTKLKYLKLKTLDYNAIFLRKKEEMERFSLLNYIDLIEYYVPRISINKFKRIGKSIVHVSGGPKCIIKGKMVDGHFEGIVQVIHKSRHDRIYEGFVNAYGSYEGYGILTVKTSSGDVIYKGNWHNNLLHGKGSILHKNGDFYEGDFINGKREGDGLFLPKIGGSFKGEFVNDKAHGNGILTYANGDIYEGRFMLGKPHDKNGKITSCDNSAVHTNRFRFGHRSGKGIITFSDNRIFKGIWKKNEVQGHGEWFLNENIICEGDYVDNILSNGYFKLLDDDEEIIVFVSLDADNLLKTSLYRLENTCNQRKYSEDDIKNEYNKYCHPASSNRKKSVKIVL
jgi:hypothetical protein